MTDPAPPPPPGPPAQWASDAPAAQQGPWASDYRSPAAGPVSKPQTIVTAVKLMYVGAALQVLGILLSFFTTDALRDQFREDDASLSTSELDSMVTGTLAVGTVLGLVFVGLWLWMAHTNGQGKSWARVVASVLGGLNLVLGVAGLVGAGIAGGTTTGGVILSLISMVVAAVVLWLLWRRESTEYYAVMSRA